MTLTGKDMWESANKYRIHQDVMRWTLLAGYAAFFTATMNVLLDASLSNRHDVYGWIAIALFIMGNCYMFVLAVENWFYNLFSRYVNSCEEKIFKGEMPLTIGVFTSENGESITPFHPSFFFAILAVTVGNSVYLFFAVREFYNCPFFKLFAIPFSTEIGVGVLHFCVAWFAIYCTSTFYIFKHWDKCVYKTFIKKLQNLFSTSEKSLIHSAD